MPHIVLATIGSLGDLHPFIAIGLVLQARGHRVVLAVPEDHVAKVVAAGLDAQAVMPSFEVVRQRLGLSERDAAARIMTDQSYLMDEVLMPPLADGVAVLDAMLADADVLVASLTVFGAPIAAEKHRLPRVDVVLQPMTLFSRTDPSRTPNLRALWGPSPGRIGRGWNRLIHRLLRGALRFRYAARIDAVRREHGLAPSPDALLLDAGRTAALTVCCYSPVFAPLPADAPPRAQAVGFAMFDSGSGAPEILSPALAAFLDAGPPPLVFTLGSFAVFAPGDFYAAAAEAARRLGRRAVLLVGAGIDLERTGAGSVPCDAVFACGYAPHSLLFPRAAAIVHHGGAGTTGQALRAGKPQLVVPHMADQPDNAARIQRLGVGRTIPAKAFTASSATAALAALLADSRCRAEAQRIGDIVAAEDGAAAAAGAIEAVARVRSRGG